MNPYPSESFAGQQGINPAPKAPAAPAAKVPAGSNSTPKSRFINPAVQSFAPVPLIPTGGQAPRNPVNMDNLDSNASWMQFAGMDGSPGTPSGGQVTYGPEQKEDTSSWRNQLYAERARNQVLNARPGGAPAGGQAGPREPMQAMKTPDMPEYSPQEYKPPEEDPGVYDKARREAMGPGMRELREGTREAISSAQSLDNPNARSKFIQQALKGYGQGLERVSAGASKEGRMEAGRQRSEDLSTYKINYEAKSDAYLTNYQNSINKIATDFAMEQAAQTANWEAGMETNGRDQFGMKTSTSMFA